MECLRKYLRTDNFNIETYILFPFDEELYYSRENYINRCKLFVCLVIYALKCFNMNVHENLKMSRCGKNILKVDLDVLRYYSCYSDIEILFEYCLRENILKSCTNASQSTIPPPRTLYYS